MQDKEKDSRKLLDIIRTGDLSDDERADIYLLGVMDAIRTLKEEATPPKIA